ncbi:MAG: beta-ketoacyl synthase [Deltaproteobacteria bacterium]|nr:beta-ketoacyl synthase [Deltaproteobacteria bacterium]
MNAPLRGIGWVTAAGAGRGRAGEPFAWEAGVLPRLAGHPVFDESVPRAGRMDEFSRLGFAAVALALRDSGLGEGREKRPVGVAASSTYGCLATDRDYFDTVVPHEGRLASPNLFAYTLPNCFLGEAAIRFGLTGPSLVVSERRPAGLEPLRLALESLAWGEAEAMLCGVCDLPAPAGLAAPQALPPGAVFLVLGGRPSASGCEPYGEVSVARGAGVCLDGAPVDSLFTLVANALAARARSPGRLPRCT